MTTINISIDVLNAYEIVKSKKGIFTGLIARLFMSEKKVKEEVEKKICEQIIEELRKNINSGFSNEGVVARVRYSYYSTQDKPAGTFENKNI